jgi:L-xylulokinase
MGKGKYILVIDNGLTVEKAAVFDLEGTIIASDSAPNSIIDKDSFSELDADLLWDKTASVIKNALLKAKIDPADIAAVGNTGFGAGIFLVDKNGSSIRNAITSMDARAMDFVEKAQAKENIFFEKTKINMWTAQAIPLLGWLKENEKDNFDRIATILQVKDWIKFKLTANYSTDYTDAGNAGLLNLLTKEYDHELYAYYGVEEISKFLPPLKKCQDITGYVSKEASLATGLAIGTPVMSGLQDVVSCAVGSGLYREDKYSIISGTWNINTAVSKNIITSKDIMACFLYADSKKYFVMDASPTSAVNLEWFLKSVLEKVSGDNFDRKHLYKVMDEEIAKRLEQDFSLLYLPFIYRSKLAKNTMGSFLGINASDDVFDLLYAIYQGVAFAHLMHLNNLKKGGVIRKSAVLSGGASNSGLWCQVFSDILDIELHTVCAKEVGLLGTAISVLMGMENISIEDAIGRMVKIKSVFKPDQKMHQIYMERFKRFKNTVEALEAI